MPLALIPRDVDEPLIERLLRLGARSRRVTILRSGSRLVAVSLLGIAVLAFLDWRYHLPALVRALALVTGLIAAVLYSLRSIRRPIQGTNDPLRVALHVESHFPALTDALASAVQFIQLPAEDDRSSPELRQEAIRQAIAESACHDLDATVNDRGTARSVVACLAVVACAAWLAFAHPGMAATAAKRLAFPFAGVDWPTKTQIEILWPQPIPSRLARGDAFELRIALRGELPDRAALTVWLEGGSPFEQVYAVPREEGKDHIKLAMRVESTRLPRDFRFQVRANDASTRLYSIAVAPPPMLAPLNGRPSPQTRLDFPRYADVPPIELPDGNSLIEAVAGTRVTIRAATDRPVARASIAYKPEQPRFNCTAPLAVLGAMTPLEVASSWALGREVWAEIPVQVSGTGTELFVSFVPRVPGTYAFRFEDATGLAGTRLFDGRVFPDPSPAVSLDRPSAGRDSLLLLPDAEIGIQVSANDKVFALRTIDLEYRTDRHEAPRAVSLADVPALETLLPNLARLMGAPLPPPTQPPLHLRPQSWVIERRVPLTALHHADGRALKEGDVLILQGAATDFDNVTGNKAPGRSQEVELQIVSRSHVESAMQQGQAELRGELLKLREQQRDARSKVQEALARLRIAGKLNPEDVDRLLQAEQTQRQIRGRINAPEDGLRTEVNRMREGLKANRLPRSATTERIEDIARELDRLAAEELEPIEPLIAQARREQEQGKPTTGPKAPLARAERHQKEVEETLQALLERLEPWSGASEARGEARTLLGDLRRAAQQSQELGRTIPPGEKPEQLSPEERAELDRAAARQERIAERGRQLAEKLNRFAEEREHAALERLQLAEEKEGEAKKKEAQGSAESDIAAARSLKNAAGDLRAQAEQAREASAAFTKEAAALRNAAQTGNVDDLKNQLRQAAPNLRQNEIGKALERQQAAAGDLQKLIDALEEKPADDMDQLAKKARQAGERIDGLTEEQELLQKKVEDAGKIANPEARREALQKLAREQERLERQTRELAQRLARAGAEEPAQELRRAAREMDEARRQLEEGEQAEATQDEALNRLDDARDQLDEGRKQQDEELLREKLAKVAEQVKSLRDRQLRTVEEAERIHATVKQARSWSRPLLSSLIGLRDQQSLVEKETRALLDKRFRDLRVFARMLRHAADAMEDAAKRIDSRREDVLDQLEDRTAYQNDLEDKDQDAILSRQRLTLKRLDQLLEALKPDAEMLKAEAARRQQQQQGQRQPMEGDPAAGRQGDNIPPLAQLKALRALQADLLEQTTVFDKQHPDRTKLDETALAELGAIEKAQREIAELVEDLNNAANEGEQP